MPLLELSIWGHHRRGLLVDLCKSITAGAEISYQNVATGPLIDHISPRPRNWAHTAAAEAAHTHTHQWHVRLNINRAGLKILILIQKLAIALWLTRYRGF